MEKSMKSATRGTRPKRGPALGGPLRALAGVLFLVPCALAQTSTQAARFSVTNYVIDAELFPSTHMLKARARVDFVPTVDLTSLSFQLQSNLRVETVSAGGQSLRFRQDGLTLAVDLSTPAAAAKPSSITVDYSGTLASADGSPVENLRLAYVAPEGSYLLY